MTDYDTQILALGPDAYWKLDETSGLTLADSSGHGHPLTLAAGAIENYAIPGVSASEIPFAEDFFTTSGASCATTSVGSYGIGSSFTIECWMGSVGTPAGVNGLVTKGYNVAEVRPWYSLGYDASGVPFFRFRNVAGTDYILSGYGNVSDATYLNRGPFHHMVGTYTPGTADLYVDGFHQRTLAVPNTGWGTGAQGLCLTVLDGNVAGPWMCAVAIYPGQLSAAQVLSNFKLGLDSNAFNFTQLQTLLVEIEADLQTIIKYVSHTYVNTP